MKRWLSGLLFASLLGLAQGQGSVGDMFAGMEWLSEVEYERYSDPTDIMSELIYQSADEVEPDSIGYRYFVSEVSPPAVLYLDVCPSGYETVWYTLESEDYAPIVIGFRSEINAMVDGEVDFADLSDLFAPVFRERQRLILGRETFSTPVYVGFCSYSETRGEYYRYHEVIIDSTSMSGALVSCEIRVNNSGNEEVLAESEAPYQTFCTGEQ